MTLAITDHAAACFLQDTRSAKVGHVCHTELTSVERVIDFSIFDPGGLPLGQSSPKGEMTQYPLRFTIVQDFNPIAPTVYETCATKVFHFLALIFHPSGSSKIKHDGANRKPVASVTKCSQESHLVSVTVFEIFPVKILTFHLLTLIGLIPEPKVTKMGDDVPSTLVYHTQKTSARSRQLCTKYVTKVFHFLAMGG